LAKSCGGGDPMKWLLINEVIHHIWEIRRLQGIEAKIVLNHEIDIVEELLKTTLR
jgi:hypothetical protein